MTGDNKTSRLKSVYGAQTQADVASVYDAWAESYDGDMAIAGYRHPAICLALLSRHVPKGARPILDAGAGTGLLGEWLGIAGYPEAHALDISRGMLAVAGRKGVYADLHEGALGTRLSFADDHFTAIISSGVFTSGHVGTEGLDDLVRICKPGGAIILTVKDILWNSGFRDHVAGYEARGVLKLVDDTGPYVSMPGEAGTSPSRCIVLRVL